MTILSPLVRQNAGALSRKPWHERTLGRRPRRSRGRERACGRRSRRDARRRPREQPLPVLAEGACVGGAAGCEAASLVGVVPQPHTERAQDKGGDPAQARRMASARSSVLLFHNTDVPSNRHPLPERIAVALGRLVVSEQLKKQRHSIHISRIKLKRGAAVESRSALDPSRQSCCGRSGGGRGRQRAGQTGAERRTERSGRDGASQRG